MLPIVIKFNVAPPSCVSAIEHISTLAFALKSARDLIWASLISVRPSIIVIHPTIICLMENLCGYTSSNKKPTSDDYPFYEAGKYGEFDVVIDHTMIKDKIYLKDDLNGQVFCEIWLMNLDLMTYWPVSTLDISPIERFSMMVGQDLSTLNGEKIAGIVKGEKAIRLRLSSGRSILISGENLRLTLDRADSNDCDRR